MIAMATLARTMAHVKTSCWTSAVTASQGMLGRHVKLTLTSVLSLLVTMEARAMTSSTDSDAHAHQVTKATGVRSTSMSAAVTHASAESAQTGWRTTCASVRLATLAKTVNAKSTNVCPHHARMEVSNRTPL